MRRDAAAVCAHHTSIAQLHSVKHISIQAASVPRVVCRSDVSLAPLLLVMQQRCSHTRDAHTALKAEEVEVVDARRQRKQTRTAPGNHGRKLHPRHHETT